MSLLDPCKKRFKRWQLASFGASLFVAVAGVTSLTPLIDPVGTAVADEAKESATMQEQLATILQAGRRVLLVELYGTDLYVFGPDHEVAGPVRRVLESLGFEPVLPPGVEVTPTQNLVQPMDVLRRSEVDHVFFMNFSRDESFVNNIQSQLAEISDGRLYRIDSTVGEAFSKRWNEAELTPKITEAMTGTAHQ